MKGMKCDYAAYSWTQVVQTFYKMTAHSTHRCPHMYVPAVPTAIPDAADAIIFPAAPLMAR